MWDQSFVLDFITEENNKLLDESQEKLLSLNPATKPVMYVENHLNVTQYDSSWSQWILTKQHWGWLGFCLNPDLSESIQHT